MLTHTADLTVQPLNQRDAENKRRFLFHFTFFGHRTEDRYTRAHTTYKIIGDRFIYRHHILFLVIVTGTQNFIYQIAVVSQENQSL